MLCFGDISEHIPKITLVPAKAMDGAIFGFSEFVTALALLFILYTITDVRCKFRVATTPIPIGFITRIATAFLAFGTLITDIWFHQELPVPKFLSDQVLWQGIFGITFLFLVLIWTYYGYFRPSIYSKYNYEKYTAKAYQLVLKGSKEELPILANELLHSARSIVRNYNELEDNESKRKTDISSCANKILLLMGNRKLCRYIISSSPVTAITFFKDMIASGKRYFPVKQFAQNITIEALNDEDSILYHEDSSYNSGLLGYWQTFSKTIYGNYELIEGLASNHSSPFDLSYMDTRSWNSKQLEAYTRISLIFVEDYLGHVVKQGRFSESRAFREILEHIENSCSDIYKLNGTSENVYESDILGRLRIGVSFVNGVIKLLEEKELPKHPLRGYKELNGYFYQGDFYDHICILMYKIILSAASYKGDSDQCWTIHYNTVWGEFFSLARNTIPQQTIHFRLRRILYNEITDKFTNYKMAKVLGFCLNVMGLKLREYSKASNYGKEYYALHKAILYWTKNNYLRIEKELPSVAKACLLGSLTFDKKNSRLVKTYITGLRKKAPQEHLELVMPRQTKKQKK